MEPCYVIFKYNDHYQITFSAREKWSGFGLPAPPALLTLSTPTMDKPVDYVTVLSTPCHVWCFLSTKFVYFPTKGYYLILNTPQVWTDLHIMLVDLLLNVLVHLRVGATPTCLYSDHLMEGHSAQQLYTYASCSAT